MTTSTTFRVLTAMTLVLGLAACDQAGGDSPDTPGGGEARGAPAAVTIDDLEFTPADLTVAPGTQVTWSNDDDAPHTVTFDDEAAGSSEELATGATFSATFSEPGTYAYVCALHPDMKGTVTVS